MSAYKLIFFLFLLSFSVIGFGQNKELDQKITITLNDKVTVREALEIMESKTEIKFAYNDFENLNKKVSVNYTNKTLRFILKDVLKKAELTYKVVGSKVIILETKNKITLSGHIIDGENGEALIGAKIYAPEIGEGAVSNTFGYFSFSLPTGVHKVTISFVGFQKQIIEVNKSKTVKIEMIPRGNLATVVVTGKKKDEVIQSSGIGKIELTSTEIKNVPAIGGEVDVLKVVALLPGVKSGVEGSSGFYVRGGSSDQNLILLDGVPLYNPYHLWGFLSTFNADAINNMEITKGAFPARYGGRLSSVLDITMNEGNTKKWESNLTVGLLSAKGFVSGPLVKDKGSMMLSARRTYADLIIVPILAFQNKDPESKVKQGYNFSDVNLKLNYRLTKKDRLLFSGFYSRDKFYFDSKTTDKTIPSTELLQKNQGWSNTIGSLRWNHLFGPKLFLNTTAYYSGYNFYTDNLYELTSKNTELLPESKKSAEYSSDIADFSFRQDYQYLPNNNHTIRFGAGGIYHSFTPGVNSFFSETGKQTINNIIENNTIKSTELSLYFEDDLSLSKRVKVNLGVHASGFLVQGETYTSVQPRISSRFLINENLSLKMGYSSMTQYVHFLTSSGLTQSSDLWVPSTAKIKPQQSHQISAGSAILIGKQYQLEIDGYYKVMNNIIDYKDGASFLSTATGWEDKVAIGKGESYGAEFFLRKKSGKLTGWLGYTLSWTNRQFDEINFGEKYPYRYDRRHDISLVGSYALTEKWTLNGLWVFNTGNAVTIPTHSYSTPGFDGDFHSWSAFPTPGSTESSEIGNSGFLNNSEKRNNYRLPAYHRLDFTAARKVKKEKTERELTFGITNMYNKLNASYYYSSQTINETTGKAENKYWKVTLFPFMPTISYKISF